MRNRVHGPNAQADIDELYARTRTFPDDPSSACNPTILSGVNTLVVDPVNGNDAAGFFNGRPIKTIKRLNQIMCGTLISNGTLTTRVTSQPPATDAPLDLNIQYENALGGVAFTLISTNTVVHSGTLATVTDVNGATNTRETLTDAAVTDWTPFQFSPLVVTSGPRQGNFVVIALVDPTHTADAPTDQPSNISGGVDPAGLQPGDPYSVVNQIELNMRQITLQGDGSGAAFIQDFRFNPATTATCVFNNFDTPGSLFLVRCRMDPTVTVNGEAATFVHCFLGTGFNGGKFILVDGVIAPILSSADSVSVGGGAYFFGFTVGVGHGQIESYNTFAENGVDQGVQHWDVFTGPALQIVSGVALVLGFIHVFGKSTNPVFSAGTIGVEASGGGQLSLLSITGGPTCPIPSVTGTGGYIAGSNGTDTDFTLDDVLTGAGDPVSRSWEEGAGTYTAQIHDSWANMAVAQPAGFGGNAQSVSTGARIGHTFI